MIALSLESLCLTVYLFGGKASKNEFNSLMDIEPLRFSISSSVRFESFRNLFILSKLSNILA